MIFFIRYTKGLGNAAIYTRLRNATGQYWNFNYREWVNPLDETADCRIFLNETQDGDAFESLYSASSYTPDGGRWIEETVRVSDYKVIGYNYITTEIENTQLTIRQLLFGYIGDADNVFSKVCGSFTGEIEFYACSIEDFSEGMNDPANATLITTMAATGVTDPLSGSLPATDGDVLFFKLSSGFNCLASTVINIYNNTNTGNTRIYVPLGLQYVASIGAYYPTTSSGLLVYENGKLLSIGESAYGRALGLIPSIDWTRITQPVILSTTAVID